MKNTLEKIWDNFYYKYPQQKAAVLLVLMCLFAATAEDIVNYVIYSNMDCSDFDYWSEAQSFFEDSGPNDPHHLDTDHDGIACESLR